MVLSREKEAGSRFPYNINAYTGVFETEGKQLETAVWSQRSRVLAGDEGTGRRGSGGQRFNERRNNFFQCAR
jgi:hypothetical protein